MANCVASVTGAWAGPRSKFRVVAQIWVNDDTGTGYNMFFRRYIEVASGSAFNGTVLSTSWGSVRLGGVGNYLVHDDQLGTYGYGDTYSLGSNYITAYYVGASSGARYQSSTGIQYTVPRPRHTVIYDANGGTGVPGNQTKTYGYILTLSDTIPVRNGYKFLGWNPDKNAKNPSYYPGGLYGLDSDIVLYAVWKQNGTLYINDDGTIKKGRPWICVDDALKAGVPWMKINGIWRKGDA